MLINLLFVLFKFSLLLLFIISLSGGVIMDLKMFFNSFMFQEHYFLLFDWVSILFFSVLMLISFSVFSFSSIYMKKSLNENRFLIILFSFVVSMVVLIFSPSLIWVLMGWDGLGVTSVLLILFFSASSSFSAGVKTYLINRFGDGLFVGSMLLLLEQGNFNILELKNIYLFLSLLLLLCFCTKSAQYPFSSWLPVAMAAPTPVSSLVHSSTLVTAGIYLLMRLKEVLATEVFHLLSTLGLYTLCLSSMAASVEWDSKKMMAYSTLSQLGLMCFSVGSGLFSFAFFHLLIHAVFKALLFMLVGYSLVEGFHLQDMRGSGGWKGNKLNSFLLMVVVFCLSGFIFFGGFYSKDLILEGLLLSNYFLDTIFWVSLLFTGYYSVRLVYYMVGGWGGNTDLWLPKSKYISSMIFLFLSSMLLGWSLKSLSIEFSKFSFFKKMMIFSLIVAGLLIFFKMKIISNLYYKKLFFLVWAKSGFVMKNFGNLGQLMSKTLDHGMMHFFMSESSKVLYTNRSLKFLNNLYTLNVWSFTLGFGLLFGLFFF